MPRLKSKATKIAYKILGTPSNISSKKTDQQRWLDRQLTYQETSRAR
jgi:hypothetical protein